jgi:hypothetical protein
MQEGSESPMVRSTRTSAADAKSAAPPTSQVASMARVSTGSARQTQQPVNPRGATGQETDSENARSFNLNSVFSLFNQQAASEAIRQEEAPRPTVWQLGGWEKMTTKKVASLEFPVMPLPETLLAAPKVERRTKKMEVKSELVEIELSWRKPKSAPPRVPQVKTMDIVPPTPPPSPPPQPPMRPQRSSSEYGYEEEEKNKDARKKGCTIT